MDGLAGDQICHWNSVAPDSILPATHLSIFVPPPLGAFVLANHQNHEDFKSTPASATQSSPIFSVQQNIQFPLLQVFSNQDELLSLARLSAAEGYLSEEVIPFLGHSHQPITFKKVRWALRFPLPPPSKDPAARRFSSTLAFRQGPRSGEALDGALFLISSLFPLRSSGTVDHSGPLFLLLLPSSLSGFQEQSIIPVHSSCYPLPLLEFLNSRSFRSTLQNSFLFPLFLSLLLSSRILFRPAAASKARRDATPLRLISWLTLKVLGRGWRFHDFFGAQTGARKEGFLHVALTTLFNKSLPWHALGPCIHSLNRNRTDVTGKSVRIF